MDFNENTLKSFIGHPGTTPIIGPSGRLIDLSGALQPLLALSCPRPLFATHAATRLIETPVELKGARKLLKQRGTGGVAWHESFARLSNVLSMPGVFDNLKRRIPDAWVTWLELSLQQYEDPFKDDFPELLEAIEALIRVELQLEVLTEHPNRDHVVHQLGDAFMAVWLFERWFSRGMVSLGTQLESIALQNCLNGFFLGPTGSTSDWGMNDIWRAGLCIAGLFHDVGYIRYEAESGIGSLREVLGHSAALVGRPDRQQVAELFWDSHLTLLLESLLTAGGKSRAISLVVELFDTAWDLHWHGPLSAAFLLRTERKMRIEGRSSNNSAGVLQLAATATFLHELHQDKPGTEWNPPAVVTACGLLRNLRLPLLFRFADNMQCWFRPELKPDSFEGSDMIRLWFPTGNLCFDVTSGLITLSPSGGCGSCLDDAAGETCEEERRKINYLKNHYRKFSGELGLKRVC